jgi:hypothetical protein
LLFTDLQEKQTDLRYPNGYRHDDSLKVLRNKLSVAELYVMDEHALAMAANVSLTKPSSILASLPFVGLPSEATWIEFDNFHARAATAALGSPNIKHKTAIAEVLRSGFLMYLDEDAETGKKDIVIEYAHKDRHPSTPDAVSDLAPIIGRFSLRDTDEFRLPFFPTLPRDKSIPTKGRVRQHLEILEKDPAEAAAYMELHARFSWEPHPDLRQLARSVATLMGEDNVTRVEENQAGDLERVFMMHVLPSLILLNCRNAVTRDYSPAPDRLNKKRKEKGRPPIREYTTVKVHLSGAAQRAMRDQGLTLANARDGSFVIGHFKVRKSGIFWWGFHMRGGGPVSGTRRVRVLTA